MSIWMTVERLGIEVNMDEERNTEKEERERMKWKDGKTGGEEVE